MPRPRMSNDKYKAYQKWSDLYEYCLTKDVDYTKVKHYWDTPKGKSLFVSNTLADFDFYVDTIVERLSNVQLPAINYQTDPNKLAYVYSFADVHFGKLGYDYNIDIAKKRLNEATDWHINRMISERVEKIYLIFGNDLIHVDSTKNTSTKGTPQDVDSDWFKMVDVALEESIKQILKLYQIAPLTIIYNPSNHDYHTGYLIAKTLKAYFKNTSIEFDISKFSRKYFRYGNNLIGSCHSDKVKQPLEMLMADERSKDWHKGQHRYFYCHHIHHQVSNQKGSVLIQYLNSPSGSDTYHYEAGYNTTPKALQGFLHDKEKGKIATYDYRF